MKPRETEERLQLGRVTSTLEEITVKKLFNLLYIN